VFPSLPRHTAFACSLTVVVLAPVSGTAHACSVCGSDDPLVAAGDSSPNVGVVRLALSFSLVSASARSDDDPSATERISRTTLSPTLVYSPIARLNVLLSVPLLYNRYSARGPNEQVSATLAGLGDVELGVRYFAWVGLNFEARRRQNLAVSAGTSLPTGGNDVSRENGERLDEHAQIGRGEFGPYVGALYAFHEDPWNFTIDGVVREFSTNHYRYRYGAAALWNVALQIRVAEPLALYAGIAGRYAARDRQAGEVQENTGGFVVQAVPGALLQLAGNLWLQARIEVPFATHLFGTQTLGPTYLAALQWAE
jgi:hypothetical protein